MTVASIPRDTDVFVAGGGPAGLAAAIAARLAGFRVVLADRCRPPIDKACGEGLMPDGAALLAKLGVEIPPEAALPFRGIRFVESGVVATARFHRGPGLGVRRTVLHEAMTRRAVELGVECLWGENVLGLAPGGVELGTGTIACRWVVGADGQNSRIRRSQGLDVPAVHRRFGMRRHYEIAPWSDFVEVHWSTGAEAYVTPVSRGQVCLALLVEGPSLRFEAALGRFPELVRRLGAAPTATDDRADGTVVRRLPRVVRGRVALVGEAAGSVDAITGEGISLALRQAVALARALGQGGLEGYERSYRRITRRSVRMGALLLAIDHRPLLRRSILRGLAALPEVFSGALAFHTGAFPLMQVKEES